MQKIVLKISGMHCPSCSLLVDGELEELAGVKSAETNFAKGESRVEFDEKMVNVNMIREVIETVGYTVLQ